MTKLHCVVETQSFLRDCQDAHVSEDDRRAMIDEVGADPKAGDVVRGSGGIRKRRFAGRGKGKSGGFRALVVYLGADVPAYILALISKGDRENFSAKEIAALKKMVDEIKKDRRGEDAH